MFDQIQWNIPPQESNLFQDQNVNDKNLPFEHLFDAQNIIVRFVNCNYIDQLFSVNKFNQYRFIDGEQITLYKNNNEYYSKDKKTGEDVAFHFEQRLEELKKKFVILDKPYDKISCILIDCRRNLKFFGTLSSEEIDQITHQVFTLDEDIVQAFQQDSQKTEYFRIKMIQNSNQVKMEVGASYKKRDQEECFQIKFTLSPYISDELCRQKLQADRPKFNTEAFKQKQTNDSQSLLNNANAIINSSSAPFDFQKQVVTQPFSTKIQTNIANTSSFQISKEQQQKNQIFQLEQKFMKYEIQLEAQSFKQQQQLNNVENKLSNLFSQFKSDIIEQLVQQMQAQTESLQSLEKKLQEQSETHAQERQHLLQQITNLETQLVSPQNLVKNSSYQQQMLDQDYQKLSIFQITKQQQGYLQSDSLKQGAYLLEMILEDNEAEFEIGIVNDGDMSEIQNKTQSAFLTFPRGDFRRGTDDELSERTFTYSFQKSTVIGIRVDTNKHIFQVLVNGWALPPINISKRIENFTFLVKVNGALEDNFFNDNGEQQI